MKKHHSAEYKKGYHDCACMIKGWILLNTSKETILKYVQRAITRNEFDEWITEGIKSGNIRKVDK